MFRPLAPRVVVTTTITLETNRVMKVERQRVFSDQILQTITVQREKGGFSHQLTSSHHKISGSGDLEKARKDLAIHEPVFAEQVSRLFKADYPMDDEIQMIGFKGSNIVRE
jgi:hypothetical protein